MCPPIYPYLYTGLLFHLTGMKQCLHSQNVQGGPERTVCVCVKRSHRAAVSARSSLPGLWFSFGSRSALDQKLPTCVCHFCQQPLRHGGWNLPPHPLFLRVGLGLYTHSQLFGPQEACLLEGTQGEKLTRTTSWETNTKKSKEKRKRP